MQIIQIYKNEDIKRENFIKEYKNELYYLNEVIIYTNEVINFAEPIDFMIIGGDTDAEITSRFKNYVISFHNSQKDAQKLKLKYFEYEDNLSVDNLEVGVYEDCKFIKTEKYTYSLMPAVVLQHAELFKEKHLKEYYYFLGEKGWGLEDKEVNFIYFVMRYFIKGILHLLKNLCYLRASATESDKVEFLAIEYNRQRKIFADCLTP